MPELEKELAAIIEENRGLRGEREALQSTARELDDANNNLAVRKDQLQAANERFLSIQNELSAELERHKETETELSRQVAELSEQVQRLADFDGKVWEKPARGGGPSFPAARECATCRSSP